MDKAKGIRHKMDEILCFKCRSQKVEPGKRCKKCGTHCIVAPAKRYKKRLIEIRLTELEQEDTDIR